MHRILPSLLLLGCSEYQYAELVFDERFDQPDVEVRADVLFVIDDSGSMSEEQALLQANFATFVTVMADAYADFQLGITTTDMSSADAGALRGGILTPDTPDLVAVASAAFAVGTHGARDERGLAAGALAASPEKNPDFSREGAKLNVVIFSDEDDHSEGPVEQWLGEFERIAGQDFAVHAVVGDLPAGCASGSSAADPGDRYIASAVQTGGWRDSICAEDYTGILTRVGLDVAGLADTFVLERIPEPGTIIVTVDDVVIPGRPVDGWQYDPGDNAVVFHGRSVPRPGMSIGVHYELMLGESAPAE